MKRRLAVLLAAFAVIPAGFILLRHADAFARPGEIVEDKVNANLVRVRINGEWQEFPMTPLAQQSCSIQDELFLRYCE